MGWKADFVHEGNISRNGENATNNVFAIVRHNFVPSISMPIGVVVVGFGFILCGRMRIEVAMYDRQLGKDSDEINQLVNAT